MNAIPYVSKVDAGTVELVRSFGVEVVSSGSFLAHFTAVISDEQGQSHVRAGKALDQIAEGIWKWIAAKLRSDEAIGELEVQQQMLREFERHGLETDSPPIVAVNAHSADPHYATSPQHSSPIKKGDWIQIDLWGKERQPGAVFGDISRVGLAGQKPSEKQQQIFTLVRSAQKKAIALVKQRFAEKKGIAGWEVDDAARKLIAQAGFGDYFIHRTGHSIETSVHGSGANMDNLEMHDERPILPSTCFSVEPAIYLPDEFGVRLESDVYVHKDGKVEVVGGEQDEIACLLRE